MAEADDTVAIEAVVDSSRRVYDQLLAEIQHLDEKAMRTNRTAVILLGFVASAITFAPAGSFSNVGFPPLFLGAAGSLALLLSALLAVAIYSSTDYQFEVRPGDLRAADRIDRQQFERGLLGRLDTVITDLHGRVESIARHLEAALYFLVLGTGLLSLSVLETILKHSYGLSYVTINVGVLAVLTLLLVAGAALTRLNMSGIWGVERRLSTEERSYGEDE